MPGTVKAIPEGYHTITPYLILDRAAEALEFYKRAFGAVEVFRMQDGSGKVRHAEIRPARVRRSRDRDHRGEPGRRDDACLAGVSPLLPGE